MPAQLNPSIDVGQDIQDLAPMPSAVRRMTKKASPKQPYIFPLQKRAATQKGPKLTRAVEIEIMIWLRPDVM